MKNISLLMGAALMASSVSSLSAAKLGDPAAPLTIKNWVKGDKVDVRDGKHVYVVEFWATWCPPCRTSIPHLTELQKKFKDKGVVFIGISDEPASKVEPFVKQMADKMDYTVACDDERKSSKGYMAAYDQHGIPTAFIVSKDGKVLWFGHPMGELETKLEEVLSGKFDLAAAIKAVELRAATSDYQKLVAAGDEKAKAAGQNLLKLAGKNVEALRDLAFGIVAGPGGDKRDFELAGQALDAAEKVNGKTARITGVRSILLFESGKQEEGLAMARKAVEMSQSDREKQLHQNYVRVMENRMKTKPAAPAAK